jgi:glycosyltransferase involved in cell wall biosynthesis
MPALDGQRLPSPPPGRAGWPWDAAPAAPPAGPDPPEDLPRITVVTPSLDQGRFLEEAIRSVLLQGYPNLEYMVIDGGSTDDSVQVIRRYEPWLAYWVSEKDRGQSHAINKGWVRATGDLVAYLNSDDTYRPGALLRAARAWMQRRDAAMVVGAIVATDERTGATGVPSLPRLPGPAPLDLSVLDHEQWRLPQQSSFWSRAALDRVGRHLREDLHYTMDRELLYRLCREGPVVLVDDVLATYRFHEASKSVRAILAFYGEDPRALACCTWGGEAARRRRSQVARWRVAQGHLKYAATVADPLEKLRHLFAAAWRRKAYLGRPQFYGIALDALGLASPARAVRDFLRTRRASG